MKNALTVGLVAAALAATLTFVAASSVKRDQVTASDALPAYEILTSVRAMGLNPISEPTRRGPYYVLHAYDPRGVEVRVVADAQFGDILSVAPARALNNAYAPRYDRGPRIIHVPQRGERDRASVNQRDVPAATNDDDDEAVAPPPRRRATPPQPRRVIPPPQRRSDAPPAPPGPRRAVLSAPPPPAEGLTPIRPIPRYNSKADQTEKFSPPRDPAVTSATPPVGYTPPAGLPRND